MVNKAILIGNIGGDPELRKTTNGSPVTDFSLATQESWSKDGKRETKSEWHKIVIWGSLAEFVCSNLHKGDRVYVEGRITYNKWEDKDGNKRSTTEIIANKIEVFWGKKTAPTDTSVNEDDEFPF